MEPPTIDAAVTVPRMINAARVAYILDISERQLMRLVHAGTFPAPLRFGGSSRWEATEVAAYVERMRAARARRKRHA